MSGRGPKLKNERNHRAHEEWMKGKKLGRPKQVWMQERVVSPDNIVEIKDHWEKVKVSNG